MAELVAAELRRLDAADADGPVVVQSFDAAALRALRADLGDGGPRCCSSSTTARRTTRWSPRGPARGLDLRAGHRPEPRPDPAARRRQTLTGISDLVAQAHRAGLQVVPWTLRAENAYLPRHLRRGTDARARIGDASAARPRMLLRPSASTG